MSRKYEQVKRYFDAGLWSIHRVRSAVEKGWITREEFALITGQEYEEEGA